MGDRDRYIHLKEISVDFIKRRPKSVLELVFKDDAGVKHKSNKFKEGNLVYWNLDTYVRSHSRATLTIQRALFKMSVAQIEIEFRPNVFGDDTAVGLEDSSGNHRRGVTVTFVCGRSRSLEEVAQVLGFQACTDLASKVPTFLKLPQLAAPTSERGYDVLSAAIHSLNNDILIGIFNCYRLNNNFSWNVRLGWRKLSQVCRRWRHLIYESTFHLDIHIECTSGTPVVDTLEHLPPLPLKVDYGYGNVFITRQDELGIYRALRLHDRLRHIHLQLPPSILHKVLVLMGECFPILEDLSLSFTAQNSITLTLPKAFLAPNLRRLTLPGISPPRRLQFLTSTVSLVRLELRNVQTSSYFRPRLLVARLASLPQLEELSIRFSIPISRPSTERELLGERGTLVTLPNLKTIRFRGVSTYLESLVAQIRAPLLERLDVALFNQIAFASPHLFHLINITEGFKLPTAKVVFSRSEVTIITTRHQSRLSDGPFHICMMSKQLDWQIYFATQICGSLIPTLSDIGRLTLDFYDEIMPTEWKNGEIDGTMWHDLLRPFTGVKDLHVYGGLSQELSRALQANEVGSDPGFLPDLQYIVAADNPFASFLDTRRVVGRPVQYSPLPWRRRSSPSFPYGS